jgi:hypothetical protein
VTHFQKCFFFAFAALKVGCFVWWKSLQIFTPVSPQSLPKSSLSAACAAWNVKPVWAKWYADCLNFYAHIKYISDMLFLLMFKKAEISYQRRINKLFCILCGKKLPIQSTLHNFQ